MAKTSFGEFESDVRQAVIVDGTGWFAFRAGELEDIFRRLTRPDWTPVEQGLPQRTGWYLITLSNDDDVQFAEFWRGDWQSIGGEPFFDVIAWAPLPQPYEPTDE